MTISVELLEEVCLSIDSLVEFPALILIGIDQTIILLRNLSEASTMQVADA